MLTIVSGDINSIKAEMKQAKQKKVDEAKALRKLHKGSHTFPKEVQTKMAELERLQSLYSSSKVLPVRVGELIINFKTYEMFTKKISGFHQMLTVDPDSIKVYYNKNNAKGVLTLQDMSSYFKEFDHIPEAVIGNGAET
ncbi:hypothetical protein [Bacillus marasmi]|uniref:hypothetical protein n=1 Tax=Bacillus marasmi TaxID=1926279 RepID=UPI0011CA16CA|nr:hypothetical protein [Bacillus marasmi]